MGRIIAIDYGLKRVGLAVTDPLCIIATPLETVPRERIIPFLKDYFEKEDVDKIVVGIPLDPEKRESNISNHVFSFESELRKNFSGKDVILQDESFTSRLAMKEMIRGGMKKKDRRKKENVDKVSATIILQNYLESRK